MIKVNLLTEKKKKSVPIPVGGIIIALWICANAAGLAYAAEQTERELDEYKRQLEPVKREVNKFKSIKKKQKQLINNLNRVRSDLAEYQQVLSKNTGSWTKVLHNFEEFVLRARTVWINSLNIDSDGQVSITGISMESNISGQINSEGKPRTSTSKGVTDFMKILREATHMVENVSLSSMVQDTIDRKKVTKFDMTFVIRED
ncbi:MAG: hypothetical protein COB02_05540 [Candidatus Cloacimonadota bacterium]|nr:MAG: hypothetical protein COB02_05540 [Candidatus Cloacimonadota bacterium]